ncbi:MAG TPA: pyridoxamine 5'-phosphate oxidase family protein [Bacteroides togonis]|nr:pyridoxamine 5'-phosphate oxidase family protein [Bacteroides togonis]
MKTISITDSKEIENIIRQCPYCMVGITDADGHPYVIPMNFAYEKGIIYLHSGPDGGKLEMIRQHPDVCITFCDGHELVWMHQQVACSYSMKSRSVICRGRVEFVDDMDEKRRILTLLMKHYIDYPCTMGDPAVRNVVVWRVRVEQMTGKSFGLRPSEL